MADNDMTLSPALAAQMHGKDPWPPAIGDALRLPLDRAICVVMTAYRLCAIYAIGPDSGSPLKVGLATNVLARRHNLQPGNWAPLVIHRVVFAGPRAEGFKIERAFHQKLSRERLTGPGDWFSITVESFDRCASEVFNDR